MDKEKEPICNTLLNIRRMKTLGLFEQGITGFHIPKENGNHQVDLSVMLTLYRKYRDKDADLLISEKEIDTDFWVGYKALLCDIDNLLAHKFLEQVDNNRIQITASGSAAYRIAQQYLKEKAEHKLLHKKIIELSLMGIFLLILNIILIAKYVC